MNISSKIKSLLKNDKIRFLLVGGFNTAFGFGTFVLIQLWIGKNVTYIGSLYLSHLVASVVAFSLYRTLVFPVTGHYVRDFIRFQTVYIVPLLTNTLLLPAFVSLLHWNVFIAQAITTVILTVLSYLGHKFFSFNRNNKKILENEKT